MGRTGLPEVNGVAKNSLGKGCNVWLAINGNVEIEVWELGVFWFSVKLRREEAAEGGNSALRAGIFKA
jgi:hypothetical protein